MSQNKTRVPGMENNAKETASAGNSVYSREAYDMNRAGNRSNNDGATRIPGVEMEQPFAKKAKANGKPVRGFLFSISRGVVGEFWPLHQGKNTIGSSPKCDICLPEATVSEEHASITIRILENQDKTIASLKDTDSTNGTKINGVDVDFDANKCKNGDVIKFGSSYECSLILIDTKEMGLKVAENFTPRDEAEEAPYEGNDTEMSGPIFYSQPVESAPAGGTVGLDGGPVFGGDTHKTVGM